MAPEGARKTMSVSRGIASAVGKGGEELRRARDRASGLSSLPGFRCPHALTTGAPRLDDGGPRRARGVTTVHHRTIAASASRRCPSRTHPRPPLEHDRRHRRVRPIPDSSSYSTRSTARHRSSNAARGRTSTLRRRDTIDSSSKAGPAPTRSPAAAAPGRKRRPPGRSLVDPGLLCCRSRAMPRSEEVEALAKLLRPARRR